VGQSVFRGSGERAGFAQRGDSLPVVSELEKDLLGVLADLRDGAAGAFCDVPLPEGGTTRMVSTPLDFSDTRWAPGGPVPEIGQHTEEILLELGYDWERIAALRESGALP
jgi:crotonobetainyl-CoA:carnitine CoA-transferase CaiB-like acyl-CoA transferase